MVANSKATEAIQRAATAFNARDFAQAERLCRQILAGGGDHFEALTLLGIIQAQTGRLEEAAALLGLAAAASPASATAHNNYGNVLRDLGRFREAVAHYEEALESYSRAARLQPQFTAAHYNQGIVLHALRRLPEALRSYDQALLTGAGAETHNNRGNVLLELGRYEEALSSYDHALGLNPTLADAHHNRGHVLRQLKRPADALRAYERALELNPHLDWLRGAWLHTRLQLCDWNGIESAITDLTARILEGRKATRPFTVLAISDDPAVQRRAAEISSEDTERLGGARPAPARAAAREMIRIGYYSADFHNHATAQLMAGLFEFHDRRRFEISAFSFTPQRHDQMTQRLAKAFDRFIDVGTRSDQEVALLSRDLGIDVAVDLKGFTQDSRPGIFARRAAALQVSYLGCPGTNGARYIDYLIADPVVIPPHTRLHYSEKVIYLPHSYFPGSYRFNAEQQPAIGGDPSRAQLGLPESGFVFCCFNSAYKILPPTFSAWMRILTAVEGSVLWLLADNPVTARNLRAQAQARGLSGERIIVAPPLPLAQHMSRHRAADLFLDTHPCGAHTTATDALWTGLPVLTHCGESLASRVAASLLTALGLPELITPTVEQYEALAIALAHDRQRLRALRSRLEAGRLTMPLFDTRLLARHLEHGYAQIYRRYHSGLNPEDILVPAQVPGAAPAQAPSG